MNVPFLLSMVVAVVVAGMMEILVEAGTMLESGTVLMLTTKSTEQVHGHLVVVVVVVVVMNCGIDEFQL